MKSDFETRLKELRAEYGIAQDKLAEKINYSKAIVSEWERGKKTPSATAVETLANFFNVSADYLLGMTDDAGISVVNTKLSSEEQRLIDYYRALPIDLRAAVVSYAQTFFELDTNAKDKRKSHI